MVGMDILVWTKTRHTPYFGGNRISDKRHLNIFFMCNFFVLFFCFCFVCVFLLLLFCCCFFGFFFFFWGGGGRKGAGVG